MSAFCIICSRIHDTHNIYILYFYIKCNEINNRRIPIDAFYDLRISRTYQIADDGCRQFDCTCVCIYLKFIIKSSGYVNQCGVQKVF